MTTLPYPLAKQLMEAGWPQPDFISTLANQWSYPENRNSIPFAEWPQVRVYSPSLSELIAACPRYIYRGEHPYEFRLVAGTEHWFAGYAWGDGSWVVVGREVTSEEAAARLWLALRKEGKV